MGSRKSRQILGWLVAILVVAVGIDLGRAHQESVAAHTANPILQPSAAAPYPTTPLLTAPATTVAATPTGYPGAQPGDQRASSNGMATVNGVQVAASDWVTISIDGDQPALCVTASIVNRTASEIGYGQQDWALQSPTGDVHAPTIILYDSATPAGQPPALQFGELIPGGSTSGRLCFSDPGTSGTYVASFHPELPQMGRAIWLVGIK